MRARFVIDHTLEIAAPPAMVWAVISDLARYAAWNPFVVRCSSTLMPGSPIAMRVRVFPCFAQPQRERVFEHIPGRRLSYGVPSLPFGALASNRSHEVDVIAPDRTRYVSHFELRGWLAPLVASLLGTRLSRGFSEMSTALAARAEALHVERVS